MIGPEIETIPTFVFEPVKSIKLCFKEENTGLSIKSIKIQSAIFLREKESFGIS